MKFGVGRDGGWLSLEVVMVLPVLALLAVGVLQVAGVVRDVLVLHEAARAGVRAAATSTGDDTVRAVVGEAADDLDVEVRVHPLHRADGDTVTVTVTTTRRLGPVSHVLRARAVARVEPAVGTTVPPVEDGDPP